MLNSTALTVDLFSMPITTKREMKCFKLFSRPQCHDMSDETQGCLDSDTSSFAVSNEFRGVAGIKRAKLATSGTIIFMDGKGRLSITSRFQGWDGVSVWIPTGFVGLLTHNVLTWCNVQSPYSFICVGLIVYISFF